MLKRISFVVILFAILIVNFQSVFAFTESKVKDYLEDREKAWPEWVLTNLKYSDLHQDLIYPNWFEGNWLIRSQDATDNPSEPIFYRVNFYKNQFQQIVGNRSENSESIGKAIFGDRLLKVKTDPKSFNNQIIYLINDEYIDSRIISRTQINEDNLFISDELFIQTVHKSGVSRINQVEVMSRFYNCDRNYENSVDSVKQICGLQYLSTYGSKVGENNVKAVTNKKYFLTFQSID